MPSKTLPSELLCSHGEEDITRAVCFVLSCCFIFVSGDMLVVVYVCSIREVEMLECCWNACSCVSICCTMYV